MKKEENIKFLNSAELRNDITKAYDDQKKTLNRILLVLVIGNIILLYLKLLK